MLIVARPLLFSLLSALFLMMAGTAKGQDDADPGMMTKASAALMVDGATGTVLFSKNPDMPFPPASLAKMMTIEIVFEAIKSGRLSLDRTFKVSEYAWRTGGAPSRTSTMFAALNSDVPVSALIRGAIVQSANDAAIILAEGLEGSEAAFAERMNARAEELGLSDSHFVNATGLPADGQVVTARDLVKLARHIRKTYPELYKIYAEPSFEWNKIFQRNRNPLLAMEVGADGMETGYTEASGYALVGVTEQNGRSTYLAMSGLESAEERSAEARKLLEFAADQFEQRTVFAGGETVGLAEVFGGAAGEVPLASKRPIEPLLPSGEPDQISAAVRYDAPLVAPIEAGSQVAMLDILVDEKIVLTVPLEAKRSVVQGSFAERALDAASELALGWLRAY